MNKFWILFLFIIILSISVYPIFFENAFAQITPPKKQWKQSSDIETITCKDGMLLLQKNDGSPACVFPSTYLKLVDRQYGKYDSELFKQPVMTEVLLNGMISNQNIMQHWHEMMIQNPSIMQKTIDMWILKMKDNPDFLTKFMTPMISDPALRTKMIAEMKSHPLMETTLKENTEWMHSVHEKIESVPDSHMDNSHKETHSHDMNQFQNQDIMTDMIHHLWVTDSVRDKMTEIMVENPTHMKLMTDQLMGQILASMMDDSIIRQQMIDMMLENTEFMNSIRHNP